MEALSRYTAFDPSTSRRASSASSPASAHACLVASAEPFPSNASRCGSRHAATVTDARAAWTSGLVPVFQPVPVVRAVTTMLCTWGWWMPCGPQWCSKEAITQRWGLTGGEPGQACGLKELERLVVR